MSDETDYPDIKNLASQVVELWRSERDYVLRNKISLREKYGSDYIGVKDGKVFDHDPDEFALAKRMEVRFRKKFVLISTLDMI